ncbi:MAG: Ldh family oxidoreductase, partial [Rhodospirillales bacterium]
DATRADEGFLLPIGGPKGYGLALMFGLLAGTLNGAAFGNDVVDFNADDTSITNTGHFIVALDIAAFTDVNSFKSEVDDIWSTMKSSSLLPGFDEIRLPGERLAKVATQRRTNGIPIHGTLQTVLNRLAKELNILPLT